MASFREVNHTFADLFRIRKVKCDEGKPHCKRCTSTGRICDGYDPTFRPPQSTTPSPPAKTRNSPQSRTGRILVRSQSPAYLAPALRFDTREERESFDFFTSHAVSSLRGFLDSPFWQREVLQAAHQNTAIQHCVIALGAMHRRFYEGKGSHLTEGDMSDNYLQFALRQSNQAIQDLVRKQAPNDAIGRTDKVTLMTCSIMFSSMCCLQGYQKDGLQHLRSGIRMLNETDEDDRFEDHPVDVESLRTIFVGLDMQARSIMPSYEAPTWVARPKTKELSLSSSSPLNMESLLAMLRYMESMSNHIFLFLQKSFLRPVEEADSVYTEYTDLIMRYHQGTVVLEALWAKAPAFGDEFIQPLTALELLLCEQEYLIRCPRPDMDAKFSFFREYTQAKHPFKESFDVAEQFVRLFELATKLLPVSSSSRPVFTTTVGPISALWLVAFRAPSSCQALRKRAVKLMLSHPRREGFWDGMVAGQICQEALKLEQESTRAELGLLPNDATEDLIVPDNLRIIAIHITYPEDNDRRARIGFSDVRDVAIGLPSAVRWISW
jgi:hypothetical protein